MDLQGKKHLAYLGDWYVFNLVQIQIKICPYRVSAILDCVCIAIYFLIPQSEVISCSIRTDDCKMHRNSRPADVPIMNIDVKWGRYESSCLYCVQIWAFKRFFFLAKYNLNLNFQRASSMAAWCNHDIILKSFQIPLNLLFAVNPRGPLHTHSLTHIHIYIHEQTVALLFTYLYSQSLDLLVPWFKLLCKTAIDSKSQH